MLKQKIKLNNNGNIALILVIMVTTLTLVSALALALINISDLTANYHLMEDEAVDIQKTACTEDALYKISQNVYATGTYALNFGVINCNYEISATVAGLKTVTSTAASLSDLGYWQGTVVSQVSVSSTPIQLVSYKDVIGDIWDNSSWSRRIRISVQPDQVAGDLYNFPVYVDLADLGSGFFAIVDHFGADIVVTLGDGSTKLARELVDINAIAETGELHFLAPYLSASTATDFYLYFGNAGASEVNDDRVWSNYQMVQHLNQNPAGTAPQMIDSTSHNNDGTSGGTMTSGDLVTGKVGKALDFDGSDDYVVVPYSMTQTQATFSTWFYPRQYGGTIWQEYRGPMGRDLSWRIYNFTANAIYLAVYNGSTNVGGNTDAGEAPSLNSWSQLTWTFDGPSQTFKIYLNGLLVKTLTSVSFPSHLYNYDNTMFIGLGDHTGYYEMDGLSDEVRFSDKLRSDDWIATEYNNQASASTFYSTSTIEVL